MDAAPSSSVDLGPAAVVVDEALTWPAHARSLVVEDRDGYLAASEALLGVKDLRRRIAETFDPHIKRAYDAHRALCREKQQAEAPLTEAEQILKTAIRRYDDAQQAKARAEEQRLLAEQRAREEERKLAEAVRLEELGKATARPELLAQAEAVLAQPVLVPAVSVPTETPKVAGITYREVWRAEVTDLAALVRAAASDASLLAYLVVDHVALNRAVQAFKNRLVVPGVRVFTEKQVAARGR